MFYSVGKIYLYLLVLFTGLNFSFAAPKFGGKSVSFHLTVSSINKTVENYDYFSIFSKNLFWGVIESFIVRYKQFNF